MLKHIISIFVSLIFVVILISCGEAVEPDNSPPVIELNSIDSVISHGDIIEISFAKVSDDEKIDHVDILLDETLVNSLTGEPWECSISTSNLSIAPHIIEAVAYDISNNSTSVTVEISVVDATAPGISFIEPKENDELLAGGYSHVKIMTDDISAVNSVSISLGSESVSLSSEGNNIWSGNIFAVDSGLTHYSDNLISTVIDQYGNESSDTINVNIVQTNNAPVININAANSVEKGDPLNITLSVTDDDNAINNCKVYIDDVSFDLENSMNWSYDLITNTMALDTYTIRVDVLDNSNSTPASETWNFTVEDTTPPLLEIIEPQDNLFIVQGEQLFVDLNPTDNDAVDKIYIFLGENLKDSMIAAPWQRNIFTDTFEISNGSLIFETFDMVGLSVRDTININVLDEEDPTLEIVSPENGLEVNKGESISINLNPADNDAVDYVELYLDGNLQETLTGPSWTSSIATDTLNVDQTYQIGFKVFDLSGNNILRTSNVMIVDTERPTINRCEIVDLDGIPISEIGTYKSFKISIDVADNDLISIIEYYYNSVKLNEIEINESVYVGIPEETIPAGSEPGENDVKVVFIDNSGNSIESNLPITVSK